MIKGLNKKFLCVLLSLIIIILCCGGCGSENNVDNSNENETLNKEPQALAIVIGRHANAGKYTSDTFGDDVRNLIENTIIEETDSKGYHLKAHVSVIICDGDPEKVPLVDKSGKSLIEKDAANQKSALESRTKMVDGIVNFLLDDDLKANDEEVDLLEAIHEAQKVLNMEKMVHNLLIIDTGFCTVGNFDMNTIDISEGEVSDVVDKVEKNGIPDLKGINVYFRGLGNVAADQEDFGGNFFLENRFIGIWESVIERSNGTLVEGELAISAHDGEPMIYTGKPDGYPKVSTIVFKDEEGNAIIPKKMNIEAKSSDGSETLAVRLEEHDIGFVPGEAEFKDENHVTSLFNGLTKNIESFLNSTKDTNGIIYVVGSIAKVHPDDDYPNDDISLKRAQKVANKLINDFGVPTDRIIVIDAGTTEFTWRNSKEFPDDTEASKDVLAMDSNRVVAIIGSNADDLVEELKGNNPEKRSYIE